MSRMIAEVYAFRNAGAEDAHARAAATALAENDRRYDELRDDIRNGDTALREDARRADAGLRERIDEVEQKLSARSGDVEQRLGALEGRVSVLERNVRLNSVLLIGLLLKPVVFD